MACTRPLVSVQLCVLAFCSRGQMWICGEGGREMFIDFMLNDIEEYLSIIKETDEVVIQSLISASTAVGSV